MPNNYDIAFTHSHRLLGDGAVAFKCSADVEKWPWLALPAWHPTVLQTINYWASVETGKTRGTFDPTKWSALTYTSWETGAPDAGAVTHGLADTPPDMVDDDKPGFRLTFFDRHGNLVVRMVGTGVIFQTRDFENWRGAAKRKAVDTATPSIEYASAQALGVATDIERFVSPLNVGSTNSATALITKDNGIMPRHPYHSGSGDHVNANHLADAALQFACLLHRNQPRCTSGAMKFRHYVELGRPFSLTQTDGNKNLTSIHVHQGEKLCTEITLKFDG